MQSTGNRGLIWRALAISLLGHVLLLSPRLAPPPTEQAGVALHAVLRSLAGQSPAPIVGAASSALASASPTETVTATAGNRSAGPQVPPMQQPAPTRGATARAESAVVDDDAIDPEGQRQYRLTLAREAGRFKRYPKGVAGTAVIRIEHRAGRVPVATLARSSGFPLLDDAALDMMRQSSLRAVLPVGLSDRNFSISLPVVFDPDAD